MTLHRPLNAFGELLQKHCERQDRSINGLAKAAGFKSISRIYYAISVRAENTRATPLSEEELLRLAKVLKLSVEAEEELIITAQLERVPTRLRRYIRRLEARNLQQQDGK